MEIYYLILIIVTIFLFVLGFIFGLLGKKSDSKLSDTFYSNTGSFSLTTDFDYEKDEDSSPVIIESVVVEDELNNSYDG